MVEYSFVSGVELSRDVMVEYSFVGGVEMSRDVMVEYIVVMVESSRVEL